MALNHLPRSLMNSTTTADRALAAQLALVARASEQAAQMRGKIRAGMGGPPLAEPPPELHRAGLSVVTSLGVFDGAGSCGPGRRMNRPSSAASQWPGTAAPPQQRKRPSSAAPTPTRSAAGGAVALARQRRRPESPSWSVGELTAANVSDDEFDELLHAVDAG